MNQQSSHGSKGIKPVRVGESVIFAENDGLSLREMFFERDRNSFVANDILLLSEHLVRKGATLRANPRDPQIVDIKIQRGNGNTFIWALCSNGYLISITRDKSTNTLSANHHRIGGLFQGEDAFVQSICSLPAPGGRSDEVWMVVRRTIDGEQEEYIERMSVPFEGEGILDNIGLNDKAAVFVDCAFLFRGSPSATMRGDTFVADPDLDTAGGSVTGTLHNGATAGKGNINLLGWAYQNT